VRARPRWLRALRYEDALLFLFAIFLQPLVIRASGNGGISGLSDTPWYLGLFYLAATVGAVLCIATRTEGVTVRTLDTDAMTATQYAQFPFLGAATLIGTAAVDSLGILPAEIVLGPIFLVTIVSFVAAPRLPTLPAARRRQLMAPMILACSSLFAGTMVQIAPVFDVARLFQSQASTQGGFFIVVFLPVAAAAVFYTMLIFAPRQLAESEGSWGEWSLRFAVFMVGTVISVWWLNLL
jgi:hypothetical protein